MNIYVDHKATDLCYSYHQGIVKAIKRKIDYSQLQSQENFDVAFKIIHVIQSLYCHLQ